ncbi:hypothetical protein evm_011859 [Chilo suppressalis]|nr:hypothetical protein evm_011859 [Chilo suppressalis]
MSLRVLYGTSAGGGGETNDITESGLELNATMSTESIGQPYFDNTTKRDYTAAVGQPAYLHCRVKNLADRAVSWIRKRDLHILTVGVHTYSSDARFAALHTDGSDEWTLRVAPAQPRDSGGYECQVSTEPKISLSFRLTVVEALHLAYHYTVNELLVKLFSKEYLPISKGRVKKSLKDRQLACDAYDITGP